MRSTAPYSSSHFRIVVTFGFIVILLIGCGFTTDETTEPAKPSTDSSSLVLNQECTAQQADPHLIQALDNGNLSQLKTSLQGCATLDPRAYNLPDSVESIFYLPELFDRPNADSTLMYLVENGGDSAARAYKLYNYEDIMAMGTAHGLTTFVKFLHAKGYPVKQNAVYNAILTNNRELYDLFIDSIPDVNEISGPYGPALQAICWQSSGDFLLWFFEDLLRRGANPDGMVDTTSYGFCESDPSVIRRASSSILEICLTRDSESSQKTVPLLIEAGAGPDIRYCTSSNSNIFSTLEFAHKIRHPLAAYMDSVAVVRGQKQP